ncbi:MULTISPECIES: alpha/beta hydrolase [unclassified Halomonas]|uniref:alpha/beta fold hydrolase n=1 Tax=unclassified Halomonas TaxID=2609666 RepID=UPI0007D9073C|nr:MULTISPECIES: alpha/beta hydrolase [unclassified Halomonas]MBT2789088.1 alpha/beta hydrolase [Halomonas sp. ISL-106]MBT2799579.1 alpha/beta hydrolase [Halomonas sp. ISL-104]OAL59695.1 alpha/beta hydrolase [Halomonas sp. ALS9]
MPPSNSTAVRAYAPQPLSLAQGRLAALSWGRTDAPVWLALHGWLDNAASFTRLAPLLVEALDIRLVALDFRGHGHSEHVPEGGDYALWDYCHDVLDAMASLELEQTSLLAHSMGAAVACLLAAALPERVERLTLIDGLGALNTPTDETASQLRKGLTAYRRPLSRAPRYPDIESAVAARVAGGVTPVDSITATPLVERNTQPTADGHVQMRTDSRLLKPSLVRFTPEQVISLLAEITAPLLLIEGEQGILGERKWAQEARQAVKGLTRQVLKGGHHLHLEPRAVAQVAAVISGHWGNASAG